MKIYNSPLQVLSKTANLPTDMENTYKDPYLIDFKKLGDPTIGYISVAQNDQLPFEVKRIFWTYFTPESIVRGRHAHYKTEQILIAAAGRIVVTTEKADATIGTFVLDNPNIGVYVPPHVWHTMQYSHTSAQLVLASSLYDEKDYIRDYDAFKHHWGLKK
jgi:mannose-6-phosphate isomerase-like protein (cupin superfamily)